MNLQALLAVLEDDFVGGGVPVHEVEAHVVLLGLVAREDGDALGDALGAGHEPPDEHLAERAGAAGDEDSLAFEEFRHVCLRVRGVFLSIAFCTVRRWTATRDYLPGEMTLSR